MTREEQKLCTFIRRHPGDKVTGFFWREAPDDYRCVVMAGVTGIRAEAAELAERTPAQLVRAAAKLGLDIGSARKVKRLCEEAGRSK